MIYSVVDAIKQFFGGSISSIEAFVGSVGLLGVIGFLFGIFWNVHTGRKTGKSIDEIKQENDKKIEAFKEQHNKEIEELKASQKANNEKFAKILMLELKKKDVPMDVVNEVIEMCKGIVNEKEAEAVVTDKQEQEAKENEITEQVNNKINTLNELV